MIKKGLIATGICVLAMAAIIFWAMGAMPATGEVPVHWDIQGNPDRFVSPDEAKKSLWILPGVSIFTGLILAVAPMVDPRKGNLLKSSRAYLAVWIGTMLLMTFVTGLLAYSMVAGPNSTNVVMSNMPKLIVGGISLLLLVMGNYLPKTKSNWFFGIRTPWTLSSEQAWEKTHRMTGRLFMVLGLAGLVCVFVAPTEWQLGIIVGGSIGIALFSLVYSFYVWRSATDRAPNADYVE